MKLFYFLASIFFWSLFSCTSAVTNRKFPKYFKWGVGTSAHQIEGGWNEDGKSPNIWDHISHLNRSFIANGDDADIACDSYHKYKEDVQMVKDLGVQFYKLSLSWSRIVPRGFAGSKVNSVAIAYYRTLLQDLVENNIEPMVTLYHWDLPQTLQDIGGWPNKVLEKHFLYFADVAFREFGDLVKTWLTFNDPLSICQYGYGFGTLAPGVLSSGISEYQCGKNILLAHTLAYRLYDLEYRENQGGRVGIAIDSPWFEPMTNSTEDIEALYRLKNYMFGWIANPIVYGDYNENMIHSLANRSNLEGYAESRMPNFCFTEKAALKASYDFIGVNHYNTFLGYSLELPIGKPHCIADLAANFTTDPSLETIGSPPQSFAPWGLRKVVKWIADTYGNPEIIITENGVSGPSDLDDEFRIRYHHAYLDSLLKAIRDDGVKVTGYSASSLMDNFHWRDGYEYKDGLYSVDFSDPERPRTPRKSAEYYKKVATTGCLYDACED